MTREEAIMELKRFSGTTTLRLSANFWEALNTAIKALEQTSPCDLCRYNPPSSGDSKPCSMCPACSVGDE